MEELPVDAGERGRASDAAFRNGAEPRGSRPSFEFRQQSIPRLLERYRHVDEQPTPDGISRVSSVTPAPTATPAPSANARATALRSSRTLPGPRPPRAETGYDVVGAGSRSRVRRGRGQFREVFHEQGDVFDALAKRRQLHSDHREPPVKVRAKAPRRHLLPRAADSSRRSRGHRSDENRLRRCAAPRAARAPWRSLAVAAREVARLSRSKKSVPSCADSKTLARWVAAPVKAPRT